MTKQQMISGQRCDSIFPAIDIGVCTKLAGSLQRGYPDNPSAPGAWFYDAGDD